MAFAWIDETRQPVVITDDEGRILALNDAFEQLFAILRSQPPSEPVEDLIIASRFRSAYRAARRIALADRQSPPAQRTSESVAIHADGGEFAVELSVATTSEPFVVSTRIQDLARDRTIVTETQTLRRAALYERAEELAGFGSWDWEPEMQRLRWSDNLFRIYGLRPREIAPSPEYAIAHSHPDDRERVRKVADLLRAGQYPELRYRYVWPDRTVRYLKATVVSVAEPSGGSRRIIGAVQDVTEEHRTERELAAHFAVSDALSNWEAGAPGARGLLRNIAEALEFEFGVMWVPRGDVLVPWVLW
jgi:PAS domain S-box-containing protein